MGNPEESFAWKDSTLDRKLKELEERAKKQSESRSSEINGFDKNIDKSIGNWSNLPKAPNPDVILLKKAREEKKVKKYLEDNYQHRTDLISPDPEIKSSENGEGKKIQGVGPKTKEESFSLRMILAKATFEKGNSGYSSEPEYSKSYSKYIESPSTYQQRTGSEINDPPSFNKKESRFEREQRIRVGNVQTYVPGAPSGVRENFSPPPGNSDKERFRVQPGRIVDYSLGRGSIAQNETYSAPQKFHLQSALKDGYESDSTLVFKRRENTTPRSTTPAEAKSIYTQIQKGGDIPVAGLRMSFPDKPKDLEDDLVLEDQILPPSNNSENKENQEEEINSTEKIETLIVIENTETPETVPPEPEIITTEELIEILQ